MSALLFLTTEDAALSFPVLGLIDLSTGKVILSFILMGDYFLLMGDTYILRRIVVREKKTFHANWRMCL